MLRIPPGHFDTSPPQWGLLSDRGDYKKFFFGLEYLRLFMDYWFVDFIKCWNGFALFQSFRKVLNSFSWTTCHTFLPRSLSSPHPQLCLSLSYLWEGWGRIEACAEPGRSTPGGAFSERYKKNDATHSPQALRYIPTTVGITQRPGGL